MMFLTFGVLTGALAAFVLYVWAWHTGRKAAA